MTENYKETQIDFSREFYENRIKCFSYLPKKKDITEEIKKFDCSEMWTKYSNKTSQNGVIGQNYQRIRIHISTVIKDKVQANKYMVFGKSKVKNIICSFKGAIKIVNAYEFTEEDNGYKRTGGVLLAEYQFDEEGCRATSRGTFKGVLESEFVLDKKLGKALLDDSNSTADGYANNTFVGTWTGHSTGEAKKCIWGDYRLPFTFDFDVGDGEMHVNDKYKKNGWDSFVDDPLTDLYERWWLSK
jgi:hypothetical protein